MPTVNCSKPDCPRTISYFCHQVTVLTGAQAEDNKKKAPGSDEEKKVKRTLTLECFDGHRANYDNLCNE